jgi:glycosyltransferase involved in cell wall biosynthesis
VADRIGKLLRSDLIGRVIERLGEQLAQSPSLKRFERREFSEASPLELQVVVAQYDRRKYEGSVERLVGVLEGLEGVKYSLLVVDNREPGDWAHPVTDRLTHIGGDNSAWEFSAFDRGLSYLESVGARAQVYALVTDAHRAYGASFLSLIDATLLRACVKQRCAIGWVDSWPAETTLFGKKYQEWLRTSFLLLPVDVLSIVRPLNAPIDAAALFSNDPTNPFLPNAPLGDALRNYLLEWLSGPEKEALLAESWHSRFNIDRATLPLFRDKVSSIVREHTLSIRLREAGVSCFDYRLFERIGKGGLRRDDFDRKALAPFEWGRWNAPDDSGIFRPLRYHLDAVDMPSQALHGEPATFHLEGWVMAANKPELIRLRIGSDRSLLSLCNQARDDVVRAYPNYEQTRPGFLLHGTVQDLPPGLHSVVLEFGSEHSIELGSIDVRPIFEFAARRLAFPGSWPAGREVPFSIDGELRSTFRADRVAVKIDGVPVKSSVFLGEAIHETSGVWLHEVRVSGFAGPLSSADQHRLELHFALSDSVEQTWTLPFTVAAVDVPCTIQRFVVGPYDPDTGLTSVVLAVDVHDVEPGDRVVLEHNHAEILEIEIHQGSIRDGSGTPRALVVIERQLSGVPAGIAQFVLVRRRGRLRSVIWSGPLQVQYKHPEIHLEELTVAVARPDRDPVHQIHVKGWVKNHFLVDCLLIDVDESTAAIIGMHELRPDVALALGSSLVHRQGFDATIEVKNVTPGDHVVHVSATQQRGERARVSRRVMFEDIPAHLLSVTSDDLDRLLRGQGTHFYSSISVRGVLHTSMEDAVVTLLVDDAIADEQPVRGAGSHEFSLRAVPEESGEYDVRFMVTSRGRQVFSTDVMRVSYRQLHFSESLADDLGALLDRFDLRSKIVGHTSDQDLTNRLLERQPERVPEFAGMLVESGKRLRGASPSRRRWEPTTITQRRRLKVLFATWEVPSRYHGGGVYLFNLLSRLGALHDITVVHTYGVDEVGHIDQLRPYMARIVSVPRVFAPAQYRGSGRFPLHLYDVYIPELRRVLELEVASGSYDVVDYEYSAMGPYVVPNVPSALTVHELGYTALLNTAFEEARPVETAVRDLDRLIRSFHYFTSELPSICNHLITLTEEDASAITTFSDAHVYTNSGGVEVDEGATRQPEHATGPVLAFVGNFQHPPNVRATKFFAQEVMPLLRRRYPSAEFLVYGSRISPSVRELDGDNGVKVVGFVDNLRARLRGATAMVAPLFTGTGQRIKVLEALGAGALVIGTDLSVRGLGAVDGEHFYRANSPHEFVEAISRAFEYPDEAASIARAGQDFVARRHGWDAAVRRREAIWFAALGDAREQPPRQKPKRAGTEA